MDTEDGTCLTLCPPCPPWWTVTAIVDRRATLLSYAVGWAIGVPVLVPILNTLASYPFMVLALRRGDLRLAVARMLLWALTMGVVRDAAVVRAAGADRRRCSCAARRIRTRCSRGC